MSYLENKIETAIKFLNKPVSCLTQVDVDAVTTLLKDMQDELDSNRYKLVYHTSDGHKQYIVKIITEMYDTYLNVVEEWALDVYTDKQITFTKPEIAKLKREYDLINWDNVICVKQNQRKEEQ